MNTETLPSLERLQRCLPATAAGAGPHTTLASLGFDSLDTVEFFCAVNEEFGVRLNTSDFPESQTMEGLLSCIEARSLEPCATL